MHFEYLLTFFRKAYAFVFQFLQQLYYSVTNRGMFMIDSFIV